MHDRANVRPIEILLVEDSLGDIELTKEALHETKLKVNLSIVMDGEQALKFLKKEDDYRDAKTPDLILLDLNLPKVDGRAVLKEIKEHPELKRIPVAVLTMSQADEDILQSYNLHVNCYITKPLNLDRFLDVVKAIEGFWFTIVTLPPRN